MEENNLWEVSINISDAFLCDFDAEAEKVSRGILLEEKNLKKNNFELLHLALIKEFGTIMLTSDALAYIFKIEEGDIDNFAAGFKVSWFGHPGRVLFKNK